jgi:probable HAF family extracellular repeat protein
MRGVRQSPVRLSLMASVLLLLTTAGWSQSLTWLGTLGGYWGWANGVSADGRVVVGQVSNAAGYGRAFRWENGVMQNLGTLGGNASSVRGVSADGRVLVGWAENAAGYGRAFRWENGVMQDLGTLGGDWGWANGISADGRVVVGQVVNAAGYGRAFRWENGVMQDIGTLPGGRESAAWGVSADGRVLVGWAENAAGQRRAFRWENGVMQDLGTLGGNRSVARSASADGSVVVGYAYNAAGLWRAFRWESGVMYDLGTPPGYGSESAAYGVSADGRVVVGVAGDYWYGRAVRWTASGEMEDLNITYASLLTPGSFLGSALAISPDGRYIVGQGYNAATGRREPYLLDTGITSNRPPAVPTLIAPAHNARVSSLPAFQLRASDPDGDWVRFEVQVWQGSDVRTFFVPASGFVPSDQVASGTPPQPLPAGTWRWKARTWDLRGGVSSWSGEWSFVVDTRAALTATPTTLPANNQSTSTLTLTYRYSDGAPIVGRTIRFISSRGSADTFSSSTAVTNAQGQASVTVRSGTAGVATFTCRDETAGVDLPASVQVTFTPVSQRRPVIDSVRTSLGVQGPFLEEVPLENTITVRVADWGDGAPGRVEFRLPNGTVRTVTPTNNEASITLNMGRDLRYTPRGEWNTVQITAYNAAGVASEVRELRFYGIETPPSLKSIFWERNPAGFIDSNSLSVVYKYFIRWPSTDITADDDVPGVAQPSQWGLVIPRVYGEVTLTFGLVTYPDPAITFTGRGSLGADIGQDFGRSPDVAIIRTWSFGWRVGVGGYAELEFGSDRPLRLRVAGIVPRVRISVTTPNLLPIVLGWMGFTGIPAAVAIACDMYGTLSCALRGEIILFDSDRGLAFRDADIYLSAAGKLTVGLSRVVENWLHLRGTVGVSGTVWIQVPERPENRAYFRTGYLRQVNGIFYIEGTARLVGFIERTLRGQKVWNYPRFRGGLFGSPFDQSFEDSGWREPDRNYLSSGEPYHQLVAGSQFFPQDDNWDVREERLIQNVFPTAEPALTWKDGNAIIVYVYDDPNLPPHQSTEIRALMQQSDGSWQDVPITQDTALDSQPRVAVDANGNLIAVWTRMEDVDPTPDPNLRLPKGEIAYAVYNAQTGAWSAPVLLTQDDRLDALPQLVRGADGQLYLVWLKSPDNVFPTDLTRPSLPHTDIWLARWDGTAFVEARRAIPRADTLEAALAVSSRGVPILVWSRDADGNPSTQDLKLYYSYWDGAGWTSPQWVWGNALPQSSPALAMGANDTPVLYFVRSELPHPEFADHTQEELLVTSFTGSGWREPLSITRDNTLDELEVISHPDGRVSAVWLASSQGVADLWTAVYDPSVGYWSNKVRLTQDEMTRESQVAAAWDPAGNPSAVYLKQQLTVGEREVEDDEGNRYPVQVTVPGRADLYLLSHRPKPDLTILEGDLTLEPGSPGPGQDVTIRVRVSNLRAMGAQNVRVRFYDGAPNAGGTPIGTVQVTPDPIVGGSFGTASLNWQVPTDGRPHVLYAWVDPDNTIAETDETNNIASYPIATLDLQAVAPVVEQYLPDGQVVLRFGVANNSHVSPSGEVRWELRLNSVDGALLAQGATTAPASGQTSPLTFTWRPELNAGRYTLYLIVDPDNRFAESDERNNTASGEIALLPDLVVNPALTTLRLASGRQAQVETTVQNLGWTEAQSAVVQVLDAPPGQGTVLASASVPGLARYASASVQMNFVLPRTVRQIWVAVNPEGAIQEVRLDNNSVSLLVPWVPGDVNGDGCVDDADLLAIMFAFGQSSGLLPEDVDRSGVVDDADLLAVLFAFGQTGIRREDVNRDGTVDDADLLAVLFAFGQSSRLLPEDLNGDGIVDDADLLEVLFNFGSGC